MKNLKIYKIITYLFIFGVFFIPLLTLAQNEPSANLYFTSLKKSYEVGEVFPVYLMLNSKIQSVNLIESNLAFSKDVLEIVSFSKNSLINFWFKDPTFSNQQGQIYFAGGIPNPGFKGTGRVLTINLKSKKIGAGWIKVSSAQVLANDGLATDIFKLATQIKFSFIEKKTPEQQSQQKQEQLLEQENLKVNRLPVPAPQIDYWGREFLLGEIGDINNKLVIRGQATPSSTVKLYFGDKGEIKESSFETITNDKGKWGFEIDDSLSFGKKLVYAGAEINGQKSELSKPIEVNLLKDNLRFLWQNIYIRIVLILIIILLGGTIIIFTIRFLLRKNIRK